MFLEYINQLFTYYGYAQPFQVNKVYYRNKP